MTESGKEFQIAGPADLRPRESNTFRTDMCWVSESMSTRRAEAREGTYRV